MIITIISECGDFPQAWTFDIEEKDFIKIAEKYGHCGESVLLDIEELPHDIRGYHK